MTLIENILGVVMVGTGGIILVETFDNGGTIPKHLYWLLNICLSAMSTIFLMAAIRGNDLMAGFFALMSVMTTITLLLQYLGRSKEKEDSNEPQ